MRLRPVISTIILAMSALTVATIESDRDTNGTMVPLAKGSPWLKLDNTVDFDAIDSHVESVDAKILRGLQNHERNTGISHSLAVHDFEKRAVGAAALTGHEYRLWHCTITVGTPPRSFTVEIDTGSSDLFLAGPTCSGCSSQTRWDPASSSTAQAEDLKFDIEFGDGATALGDQYTDTLTIAGLTADIQTIGAATMYEEIEAPPDGVLGMAFESLSDYPASPVFETLVNEGKVTEPVFSIKLTPDGGELYLGGTNGDLYTGNIIYTPVTEEGFWEVNIQEIGGSNHQAILRNIAAIIDTGSNMIIGDQSQVANLYRRLGGKSIGRGYYSFPCNNFPSISFSFGGGRTFEVPASILDQGPLWTGSPDCFSGIVGRGKRTSWTLGSVFLETVYTVFDFGNKRVGFANLASS